MSLVGNIAGKGFLPVSLLTLAHSSVMTGVTPRICQVAIFWKAPRESIARNTRKHSKRASHPRSTYDPIPPLSNPHFSRAQAMYTCIHET